jgi:hypothetical protein
VQFTIAVAIGYVTTRLIEWPMLYYRESIPWLRDSKPLLATAEDPGPSNPVHQPEDSIATPSVESS